MLSINRQWITELMVLGMWIFHNFFVFLQCLFFGFSSLVPFSSSWRRRWWFWWMTLIWCWKIIYTKIVVTVCSDVDVNCILFYDIRYPLGNASLTVRINVSLLVFLSIITNESNKKKKILFWQRCIELLYEKSIYLIWWGKKNVFLVIQCHWKMSI